MHGTIVDVIYGAAPHPTSPDLVGEHAEVGMYWDNLGERDEILMPDGRLILCAPSCVRVRCFPTSPGYARLKAQYFGTMKHAA